LQRLIGIAAGGFLFATRLGGTELRLEHDSGLSALEFAFRVPLSCESGKFLR